MTFKISAYRLDWLQAKLVKLNKKAAKLNTAPMTLTVLSTYEKEKTLNKGTQFERKVAETWHEVEVAGDAPVIAGWQFVATLEHMNEGTLLRTVPTIENVDLSAYRNASPSDCDHCKTDRRRNNTYVVRNVETDELKQVGRSCLRDFLGHASPEQYAAWAEAMSGYIEEFGGSDDDMDFETGCRSGRFGVEIVGYLSYVNASIDKDGWVSGKMAWDRGGLSTAHRAMDQYFIKEDSCRLHPTEADVALATKAVEWAQNLSDTETAGNDYLHNLRVAAAEKTVYWSTQGIIASAVQAYRRHVEKQIVAAKVEKQNKTNEFVGTVGKRDFFTVTVLNVHIVNGAYGTTYIYKMEDEDGNKLTWFASNDDLEQGKRYVLKATVKKHDENERFGNTTVITRAKIEEAL